MIQARNTREKVAAAPHPTRSSSTIVNERGHVESALISSIRGESRALVRELGLLAARSRTGELTLAECHALIEIDTKPGSTVLELADRLRIDKAATSRSVAVLTRRGFVRGVADRADRRRKPFFVTARGRTHLASIHAAANATVRNAMLHLAPAERQAIVKSLARYAEALAKSRRAASFEIRAIERRDDEAMASVIRAVMTEHGASGEGYSIHDAEVDAMSRAYKGPRAKYYVVKRADRVVGGGGFAPLLGADEKTCELRKMYFLDECRGLGLGRALMDRLLRDMRAAGYRRCYLETLASMRAARKLYGECGFKERCGPLGKTGHYSCDSFFERDLTS